MSLNLEDFNRPVDFGIMSVNNSKKKKKNKYHCLNGKELIDPIYHMHIPLSAPFLVTFLQWKNYSLACFLHYS